MKIYKIYFHIFVLNKPIYFKSCKLAKSLEIVNYLIITAQSNDEYNRGDIFKTMYPLLSLSTLSPYVHDDKRNSFKRKPENKKKCF